MGGPRITSRQHVWTMKIRAFFSLNLYAAAVQQKRGYSAILRREEKRVLVWMTAALIGPGGTLIGRWFRLSHSGHVRECNKWQC